MSNFDNFVRRFLQDGAVVVPGILTSEELSHLRPFCRAKVEGYTPTVNPDSPAAPVYPQDFKDLIIKGAALLSKMGFNDPRFHSGALIPKWQGEGRRGYHVDSWYWEDSLDAWKEIPPQVGLLFYLDPAVETTGALTIVPGSHRREVAGHYEYWETRRPHPDEVVLEANPGDVALLNPAVMHGVTGNEEIDVRHCLTLWYMLDFANLDPRIRATVMLSAPNFQDTIGSLAPDYAGDAKYFFHCKKPQFPLTLQRISALRHGKTDAAILQDVRQPEDDFIDQHETYTWYRAIGAARAPRSILELGVRYGYAGYSLIKGAQWAGIKSPLYVGVDAEVDGHPCISIAFDNINKCYTDASHWTPGHHTMLKQDTRDVNATNAAINGRGTFDIIHVDGDHSAEGILNELSIAKMWAKPTGCILVDDVDVPHVEKAALILCQDYGITPLHIPTYHGVLLVDLKKRTRFGYDT